MKYSDELSIGNRRACVCFSFFFHRVPPCLFSFFHFHFFHFSCDSLRWKIPTSLPHVEARHAIAENGSDGLNSKSSLHSSNNNYGATKVQLARMWLPIRLIKLRFLRLSCCIHSLLLHSFVSKDPIVFYWFCPAPTHCCKYILFSVFYKIFKKTKTILTLSIIKVTKLFTLIHYCNLLEIF